MCVLFLVADARTKRDNNPVRPKNRDKEEALPRFILDSRDREFPNPGTRFGGASVLTDAPSPTNGIVIVGGRPSLGFSLKNEYRQI